MTYLLDTNAWLRLFQFPNQINADVRKKLHRESLLAVSPFSLIEIAQKNATAPERLGLSLRIDGWLAMALPRNRIRLLPITPEIAVKAYDLGADFHGDPADRVITATAMVNNLTLVTSDKLLLGCGLMKTLSTH